MQRSARIGQVCLILLIALGVRLLGIESRPIWYDEAFAILFAQTGPAAMLQGTLAPTGAGASDIHPLGYYTILWVWMKLFGSSLPAVRSLSIVAGLASVGLVYLLGAELFEPRTAAVGAVFAAILPFQVHYAQEIRMYALAAACLLLATYAYVRGARGGRWGWWATLAVAAAAAQYTHHLSAIYLIPLALTPVIRRQWSTAGKVALSALLAIALYAPWLVQLGAQLTKVREYYWIARPGIDRLFALMLVYVPNLPLPDAWLPPGLLAAALVVAVGSYQTIRALVGREENWRIGFWLGYLAFAPALLLWATSQALPVYIERALLAANGSFCLWLAWALVGTRMPAAIRNATVGIVALAAAAGLYQHVTYAGFPYAPFEMLTASLRREARSGDVIVHSNKLSLLPAVYFDAELPQVYIADPPGGRTDTLAPATREILRVQAAPNIASATADADRVWYVIYGASIDEYARAGYAGHPDLLWLEEHFALDHTEEWGDLQILLFDHDILKGPATTASS